MSLRSADGLRLLQADDYTTLRPSAPTPGMFARDASASISPLRQVLSAFLACVPATKASSHQGSTASRAPKQVAFLEMLGLLVWALPSQWPTISSSPWGKASTMENSLQEKRSLFFFFQLPLLGRKDTKTAFPLGCSTVIGGSLPSPVPEPLKNRVIQEEEDLRATLVILPHRPS